MKPWSTGTVLARFSRTEALVAIRGRDRLVSTSAVPDLRAGEWVLVGEEGVVARISQMEAMAADAAPAVHVAEVVAPRPADR